MSTHLLADRQERSTCHGSMFHERNTPPKLYLKLTYEMRNLVLP